MSDASDETKLCPAVRRANSGRRAKMPLLRRLSRSVGPTGTSAQRGRASADAGRPAGVGDRGRLSGTVRHSSRSFGLPVLVLAVVFGFIALRKIKQRSGAVGQGAGMVWNHRRRTNDRWRLSLFVILVIIGADRGIWRQ